MKKPSPWEGEEDEALGMMLVRAGALLASAITHAGCGNAGVVKGAQEFERYILGEAER